MSDPLAMFEAAGREQQRHAEYEKLFARIRADAARQIWEGGDLSIAQLAARLGISKARADQLLRRAREQG